MKKANAVRVNGNMIFKGQKLTYCVERTIAAIMADLKTKDLAQRLSHRCSPFFHEVSRAGGP